MSKNIVDAVLDFCAKNNKSIGLIPSRRQVDWNGGYVNNWTTQKLSDYVKGRLILQRDHAGPNQGSTNDDGYRSLIEDCKYVDSIHIDPWALYSDYTQGLKATVNMIKFCEENGFNSTYEVGTEEAIRRFETIEIKKLLDDLSTQLDTTAFKKIKYIVIQSGTEITENINIGRFEQPRILEMVSIAKTYNLLTKEHNGDYLPLNIIKKKFELGLDAINIAPEFGLIETNVYLNRIKQEHTEKLLKYYDICYQSQKWKKWVKPGFEPSKQKEKLIKICGHYVLTDPIFLSEIKSCFPNIDEEIRDNITCKLKSLFSILT